MYYLEFFLENKSISSKPVITLLVAGENTISGGTRTVLLPVEEDGATRCICQQDSTREEEIYSTSRSHVSLDTFINYTLDHNCSLVTSRSQTAGNN